MRHNHGRKEAPARRAEPRRVEQPRRSVEPMNGLFMLRTAGNEHGPVMARIADELYLMVYSNAARAIAARQNLGVDDAQPFYICDANRNQLVSELRAAGARGFIVDYDPEKGAYTKAGEIPAVETGPLIP